LEEQSTRTNQTFRLFVYGTLKRGFSNHARFCESASNIEEAAACGDLYDLPFGFPALVVSGKNIQAVGTTAYAFDAAEQHRMDEAGQFTVFDEPRVYGEVFTFDDPEERLPELDRLEGFDPEGHSLYRRVLIPVEVATGGVLAWAYVIDRPAGTLLPTGRWPS
jgi:gamma-glutamylcyclotransferase (GGCT)/AIG2-like uncharacterized protein YtfP